MENVWEFKDGPIIHAFTGKDGQSYIIQGPLSPEALALLPEPVTTARIEAVDVANKTIWFWPA